MKHSLPVLAAAVVLAGCGEFPKQLHVDDRSRPVVSARGLWRLGEGPGGPGLELEHLQAHARGEQTLGSLDVATLEGRSLTGPGLLHHDVHAYDTSLLYNHRLFPGRLLELEWFAGVSWHTTDWSTTSDTPGDPRLSRRATWSGPAGGVLGRVNLAPGLSIEGRYSGAARVWGETYGSRYNAELAFAFRPPGPLVLRAGLAEHRSWIDSDGLNSELSVRARGPFLNLGLEF